MKLMKLIPIIAAFTLLAGSAAFAQTQPQPAAAAASAEGVGIAVQNNESIAFLGDSITQFGAALPGGYAQLVISGLKANGVTASLIPAGISGNKSNQMLERLERDVLSKKPTWMTLSCGVNDVWHGVNGIPLDKYKENIAALVDQAQAAGVKVMILTATMIGEDALNPNNVKLAAYNDFLRGLAGEKKCVLADLNADMHAAIKPASDGKPQRGNQLTRDGVHMNPFGDQVMATGVLRAFGLNESQLQKARDYWINMPEIACEAQARAGMTLRQYKQLSDMAAEKNCSLESMLNAELTKAVQALAPAETAEKKP